MTALSAYAQVKLMTPPTKTKRRFGLWLAILGVLALPASCITWTVVADPLAEWQAHAFCDDIPVGAGELLKDFVLPR